MLHVKVKIPEILSFISYEEHFYLYTGRCKLNNPARSRPCVLPLCCARTAAVYSNATQRGCPPFPTLHAPAPAAPPSAAAAQLPGKHCPAVCVSTLLVQPNYKIFSLLENFTCRWRLHVPFRKAGKYTDPAIFHRP